MRHVSSRPDRWTEPRPHRDPAQRRRIYGQLQSMDEEPRRIGWVQGVVIALGFWAALFLFALVTP